MIVFQYQSWMMVIWILSACCSPGLVHAQDICVDQLLPVPEDMVNNQIGHAMDLDGDVLVVGNHELTSATGERIGAVHVFRRSANKWMFEDTIRAPDDLTENGNFGGAVAVHDDVIVVGAKDADTSLVRGGRAFVYRHDDLTGHWSLEQELFAFDGGEHYNKFGDAVDVYGNLIAVGDTSGVHGGGVTLFEFSNSQWLAVKYLQSITADSAARFGEHLAILPDTLVVTASREDVASTYNGAVYFYENHGLNDETPQVMYGESTEYFALGAAMATDGQKIALLTGQPSVSGDDMLIVHHDGMQWTEHSRLFTGGHNTILALWGDHLVVSRRDDDNGMPVQSFYQWSGSSWPEIGQIEYDQVFRGTTLNGQFLVTANSGGTSWIDGVTQVQPQILCYAFFDDDMRDCNNNGIGDGCEIEADPMLDCNVNWVIDSCEDLSDPALDCDGNSLIDSCEIDATPSLDCNANGILDPCDIATDPILDCDSNGILDQCEGPIDPAEDCDGNGIHDACDLAFDPNLDCDANGLIDACELVQTPVRDCDRSGVLDACEIAAGILSDSDGDGYPDGCALTGDEYQFILHTADRRIYAIASWGCEACGEFGEPVSHVDEEEVHLTTLSDMNQSINVSESGSAGGGSAGASQFSTLQPMVMTFNLMSEATSGISHDGQSGYASALSHSNVDFEVTHDGIYELVGTVSLVNSVEDVVTGSITSLSMLAMGQSLLMNEYALSETGSSLILLQLELDAGTVYSLELGNQIPFGPEGILVTVSLDLEFRPVGFQYEDPCVWDITGTGDQPDNQVNVEDFFALLQHWGPCPLLPDPCPWDFTGPEGMQDGTVGVDDFFALLQNWGPCD
jgi:hypothetical protein